jgi:hypothetical protein
VHSRSPQVSTLFHLHVLHLNLLNYEAVYYNSKWTPSSHALSYLIIIVGQTAECRTESLGFMDVTHRMEF